MIRNVECKATAMPTTLYAELDIAKRLHAPRCEDNKNL
jgi:hypothetical protein